MAWVLFAKRFDCINLSTQESRSSSRAMLVFFFLAKVIPCNTPLYRKVYKPCYYIVLYGGNLGYKSSVKLDAGGVRP